MSDLFKNSEHLKLNHHNYMFWRNLIRTDLLAVDAYEIAIGNEQYPDGTTNAIRAQQHDFRKRVGKGLRAILSSCADDDKSQISYIDNLSELWEALKAKYDTQDSYKARLLVRNDFDSCIAQKDEKIGAYVAHLSSLRQQLTGTEFAIDDRIFLNHLFDPRPNIDTAIRRIMITEQQHDADEGNHTTATPPTADGLFTHGWGRGRSGRGGHDGRGQHGRGGRGREKGREGKQYNCTHCMMDNHTTTECGHARTPSNSKATQDSAKTCFYCALPGHVWDQCLIRKRAVETHGPRNSLNGPRKKQNTGTATIAITGSDNGYNDCPLH